MFWPFKSRIVPTDPPEPEDPVSKLSRFRTHDDEFDPGSTMTVADRLKELQAIAPKEPPAPVAVDGEVAAMDTEDWEGDSTAKGYMRGQPNIPDALAQWYASQSFIGYQLAGLIAQHWLIMKACALPARDAVRHGFTITTADGDKLPAEVLQKMKRADKAYRLNKNMVEFIRMGRVFGIRICIFKVNYGDRKACDEAYAKPFNIDGVPKGGYLGMVQVDPYWCSPELDGVASSQPDSMHFYEPTWWQINGRRYHRSHLAIFRNSDVVDILKPAYLYGGVPVPQLIMERVYGAERTANEAPLLALTKRTMVYKTDLAQALANFTGFVAKLTKWDRLWNNKGLRVIGEADEINQIDTSLADLDDVIMTQYQLVAAGANVPSTKLLGTAPKGFNATGEFDESSYHEELESIQTHDLTPMVERHHALLLKSLGVVNVETTISWEPLDSPTAKEYAEINKIKSETAKNLVDIGAIDGPDDRRRIASDKNSDYADIDADADTPEDEHGPAGPGSAPPQAVSQPAAPAPTQQPATAQAVA